MVSAAANVETLSSLFQSWARHYVHNMYLVTYPIIIESAFEELLDLLDR